MLAYEINKYKLRQMLPEAEMKLQLAIYYVIQKQKEKNDRNIEAFERNKKLKLDQLKRIKSSMNKDLSLAEILENM